MYGFHHQSLIHREKTQCAFYKASSFSRGDFIHSGIRQTQRVDSDGRRVGKCFSHQTETLLELRPTEGSLFWEAILKIVTTFGSPDV